MQWFSRLGGVLVSPRKTFEQLLKGGQGGVGDIVWFMLLAMFGTQPLNSAKAFLGAGQGLLVPFTKIANMFFGFALGPLVVLFALGLLLAGVARIRGLKTSVDGLLTAMTYLWVPVGLLGMLGALLVELGLANIVLPHVPLGYFFRMDPPWWKILLKLVLSYGVSAYLGWILLKVVFGRSKKPKKSEPKPSRIPGWIVMGSLLLSWTGAAIYANANYDRIRPILPGDTAKDFKLQRADGRGSITLSSLRGKPVVLEFWADWCSVCMGHMPDLERWAEAHKSIPVLAIHQGGSVTGVKKLLSKHGWSKATFLIDGRNSVSGKYRVDTLPTFFVLDTKGQIVDVKIGSAGDGWLNDAVKRAGAK